MQSAQPNDRQGQSQAAGRQTMRAHNDRHRTAALRRNCCMQDQSRGDGGMSAGGCRCAGAPVTLQGCDASSTAALLASARRPRCAAAADERTRMMQGSGNIPGIDAAWLQATSTHCAVPLQLQCLLSIAACSLARAAAMRSSCRCALSAAQLTVLHSSLLHRQLF